MRPAGCEAEVIRALASMPFLDRTEMVAVTGRSKGAVYEAVERLEQGGFCTAVPHAAPLFPQTQRYHLAAAGLHWLAGEEGRSLDDLMLERPLSAQWRRNLMERLDALASIYRLAAALAALEYPIRFRWYREREGWGHGLRNMAANAQRMGGRLQVSPGVGGVGARVTCIVPCQASPEGS